LLESDIPELAIYQLGAFRNKNMSKTESPIQAFYPPGTRVCYGCGVEHPSGLHLETRWDGEKGTCRFTPPEDQLGYPGLVYGGLIASLIDCHAVGTATAAAYAAEGRQPGSAPVIVHVTGSLKVDYLLPTPMGPELLLEARVRSVERGRSLVDCGLSAGGKLRARGQVLCVRVTPERLAAMAGSPAGRD
jgi:acyl-coenzyme A thioesterase PaaI-like protein